MTIKSKWINSDTFFLFVVLIFSIFYIRGVFFVPFHPDESTQIFMSKDIDLMLRHPAEMFWNPEAETDLIQKYRELDSPITRYLIGLGRKVTGMPELKQDWNWSNTWTENANAGAFPDANLLTISRISVSVLFPFSLMGIYLIGKKTANPLAGWMAALLFAGNALILLHTRRAMAESALLFTLIISLWLTITERKSQWVIAFPIALAFNSKYSVLPLFFLGIFAIAFNHTLISHSFSRLAKNLALYLISFALITYFLNPFLWKQPVKAFIAAANARIELTSQQIAMSNQVSPEKTLDSLPLRIQSMVFHLFLSPPAIADVGNYLTETNPSETIYFSNPLNNALSGVIWGALFLTLSIAGFIYGSIFLFREKAKSHFELLILWVGTILQTGFLIFFVPNSFQRYYLPIVVFSALWSGFLLGQFPKIEKFTR
jgi:hypothetical protein